jgi:hypothetical protein
MPTATTTEAGSRFKNGLKSPTRLHDEASLLIADQFEEAFTLVEEGILQLFFDTLLAGFPDPASGASPNICLILTLRASAPVPVAAPTLGPSSESHHTTGSEVNGGFAYVLVVVAIDF